MARYDAVVVGGGHNGLVAAGYLARRGLRVLVLERRHVVGGPCSRLEYFPGYWGSFANSPGSLEPKIVQDLSLEEHGLSFVRPDPYVVQPVDDRRAFIAWRDRQRMIDQLSAFSARDALAYHRFFDFLLAFATRLRVSLFKPPPSLRDLLARLETPGDEETFAKVMWGSIGGLVDEWFESDALKSVFTMLALMSSVAGPHTPGTPLMLLHRPLSIASRAMEAGYDPRAFPMRGSAGLPMGGMGAIAEAMRRSIESAGADVRAGAQVDRVLVRGERVRGVVLSNGEEIHAPVVISNLNPKTTFLRLLDSDVLPRAFRERVEHLTMSGSQFKLGLALDGVPHFGAARNDGEAVALASCQFRIAPSMDYIERAWQDVERGCWSRTPLMWGLVPSLSDPSLAPPGKHVMSVNIYHAPYTLRDGDWERERDRFGHHCIDVLSRFIPNLKEIIIDYRFWSPVDIERELGLVGGNITHGDMLPDRMFSLRPLPGWADYRTPVGGLYLCGVGTWPGGYVSGVPGHNAAHQVLGDLEEGIERVHERVMREGRPGT